MSSAIWDNYIPTNIAYQAKNQVFENTMSTTLVADMIANKTYESIYICVAEAVPSLIQETMSPEPVPSSLTNVAEHQVQTA